MEKQITLGDRNVSYTLRKSRRTRKMRLAVYCDGSVVVTTPYGSKENLLEKFMTEKKDWLFSKISYFKKFQGSPMARFSRKDYLKHKNRTLRLAKERVNYFNKIYKFEHNKISIKNQKTRWGSCSRKGNLNFNYKILFLSKKARDYIIAHELCHLKEFNHSLKFWSLVGEIIPDYLKIRKEIRKDSLNLQ